MNPGAGRAGGAPLLAVPWMVGALFAFSLVGVATRELAVGSGVGLFQVLFLRAAIGLVIVAPFVIRGGWASVRSHRLRLHWLRNTVHYGAAYGWYLGVAVLPLANVFALEFTSPIWVAVLAVVFLSERMNAGRAVAVALGVAGALIILRPGVEGFSVASLIVLGSALAFAISHIAIKELTRTDSILKVLFWMAAMQTPFSLIPALANWTPMDGTAWFWAAVLGLAATGAHYCLTRALSLADATIVVAMDFLRVPLRAGRLPRLRRGHRRLGASGRGGHLRRQLLQLAARTPERRIGVHAVQLLDCPRGPRVRADSHGLSVSGRGLAVRHPLLRGLAAVRQVEEVVGLDRAVSDCLQSLKDSP